MNFSLRQLRAFSAVARTASFTRASESLHLTQPALTVQIRGLEEALGVRLFDRSTRQVRLSAAGRELLPVLERALRDIDSVARSSRELAAGHRGVVEVAALPSISSTLLPEAIAKLRAGRPGIAVRIRDTTAQRILALVRAEEVDFGIGSFARVDQGMTLEPLTSDRMHAVFPAGHALARRRRLALADLVAHPLVFMDTTSSVRALVERAFASAGLAVTPAYEVTYMSTAVGLARAGLAIALLPGSAFELDALEGLASRELKEPSLERRIGVVRMAGRPPSPAAERLLDALGGSARAR